MKQFLFLLVFILLPLSVIEAATYFVNTTTGSDTLNNCTMAQNAGTPKKTINAGLGCVPNALGAGANQIVEVAAGLYVESVDSVNAVFPSGTSWAAPFTLRAKIGDLVTIKNSSGLNMRIFSDSPVYAIIQGFTFDGTNLSPIEIDQVVFGSSINGGSFIRFQGNELINNVRNHGILIGRLSNNDEILNNKIHGGGFTCTASSGGDFCYPMYVQGSNILIEGNEIYTFPSWGIHMYSGYSEQPNDNIIRNNKIHDFGTGDPTRSQGILVAASGARTQVYNNIVYNGTQGIGIGGSNVIVYSNTVYNNSGQGIGTNGALTSIKNNIVYLNNPNITAAGDTTQATNVTTNPLFVNPTAGNFHLQATSTIAINQGTPLGAPYNIDFDGVARPQGAGWDVGAFEFSAIYWVSTTGNNANSCASVLSSTDPGVYKRDITGANGGLSCLSAGATLKIKGGTYSEYLRYDLAGLTLPNGTSDTARITIQRSAADQAVILRSPRTFPSNVMPIDFLGQSYWTLDGITVDCENFITGGACVRISGSNINFINGEIKNASTTCFLGGSPGGLYSNNKIHDCSAHGTTTPPEHGIYVAASNTTVEKNEVYNVEGWGIHVFDQNNAVSNVTVRANTVHDFAQGGVGGDGILLSRGTNNLAYNNVVYRGTGANGIRIGLCLAGCTGSALYNNTIYNVTQGIQLDTNIGVLVKNNIISSAGSPPISDTGSGTVFATNLCDIAAMGCTNVGNPNFVSPTNDNFQLQASSTAVINRGTDLSSLFTTDILAVARPSGAWDIGAYEFASEVVPPTVPSLVARYGFNEVSGSTVLDSSGKGNHGTFGAGVTRVTPGKYGKGLQFTNGTVTVPHSTSLNLTDGMTIAAWIQPTVSDTGYHTLLSKTSNYFVFSPSGTGSCLPGGAYGGFVVGSVFRACSTSALTTNVWTHVALTYSVANNRLRFYVNGALTQETTVNVNMLTNTDNLLIGNSAVDETFTGYIDEMWIYNFEKTQAEVVTIMNTPVDVAVSPPSYALGPTGSKKIAPGAPIKTGRIIAP